MSKKEEKSIKPKILNPKKNLTGMNLNKLSNVRIIQKHLVYVIGLSSSLANKEILGKHEYFGQYGTIMKIVVNKTKAYNPNGRNGPSYSAYISYQTEQEASVSILAIDNIEIDEHVLRASFGTTKYCTFFLKSTECPNKDCLYLHELADESNIVNRDEMSCNFNLFYDQQLLAMKLADIFNPEVKKKLKVPVKKKSILPSPDSIYTKDIVVEQMNNYGGEHYSNYYESTYKYKKRYNNDDYYYKHKYDAKEDYYYRNQEDGEDHDFYRKKSENYTSKKNEEEGLGYQLNETTKFISKSKSPIVNKKKAMTTSIISESNLQSSQSPDLKKLETYSADENKSENKEKEIKRLYRKHEKSRFDFVKGNYKHTENPNNITLVNIGEVEKDLSPVAKSTNCHSSESNISESVQKEAASVPDYVFDVICKKISRYSFFKKFDKEFQKGNNDVELFEKDLKLNDSWSQFILTNLKGEKIN